MLTILREVILYEVDLPMELWYREAREFPSAVLSTAAGQLSGLKTRAAGDEVSRVEGIERKLQAFLKELETRLRAYIKDHTGPRRG